MDREGRLPEENRTIIQTLVQENFHNLIHMFQIACSNLVLPVISRLAPRAPRHQVLVQRVHV